MSTDDYSALGAWAFAKHKLSPADVQCALVVAFGADYDTAVISLQGAQQACANYAAMVDDLTDAPITRRDKAYLSRLVTHVRKYTFSAID